MAVAVFIDVNSAQIRRVIATLGDDKKALRDVTRRASGRAAIAVKVFMGRRIRVDRNIKNSDLERTIGGRGQKALYVTRVKEDGKRTIFSSVVLSEESQPSLKLFGARQLGGTGRFGSKGRLKLDTMALARDTARLVRGQFRGAASARGGVSYKIDPKGGRSFIPQAFLGPGKLAGQVYLREGKKRNPLRKLRGASPWGAYMTRDHGPEVQRISTETFAKRIEHEVEFELTRRGAGRG